LVLRLKPRNRCGDFVGQISKPQLPVLRPKLGNVSEWFGCQTTRTIATGFEAKLGKTVDLGFESKPRNSRSSSPCAWCRLHTASLDLSIISDMGDTDSQLNMMLSQETIILGSNSRTLKFLGNIQGQEVVILNDSSSSNSFVNAKLAPMLLGISQLSNPIKVQVANGQVLQCTT
jgi:hypothetical protein